MFETYTVKQGDCLWNIAQAHYGNAQFWPSLYSFNNWAASQHIQNAGFIINPNLIYPRQKILLPDLDMTLLRPILENPKLAAAIHRADARAAGKPAIPAFTAQPLVLSPAQVARDKRANPAAYLGFKPFLAFEYDLDDLRTTVVETPLFTAEIKWSGKIVIQPVHDAALITLSNHGAILAHEFHANTVFGDLGSEASVIWKPGDKHPAFACNLTRAGDGPIPKITIEADQDGPKFLLSWKPFTGRFRAYDFIAVARAEITIKPKTNGQSTGPRTYVSIPSTHINVANVSPRSFTAIPGRKPPMIASNPRHFGWPRVNPSGVAPLVGTSLVGGILLYLAANPEWLALAFVA